MYETGALGLNYAMLAAFALKPYAPFIFQSSWGNFYHINVSDSMASIGDNRLWLHIMTAIAFAVFS